MSAIPYAHALAGRDPQPVIAATPARLAAVLSRLTPEQIEARPTPGKWNLREIVCHLADCEIAWSWRLRYAYGEADAHMQSFEQDPWAKVYGAYTLEQALATFNALRAWNVAFVGALKDADRQRAMSHPEIGAMHLWQLVEIMAGHDLHHLASLEAAAVSPLET